MEGKSGVILISVLWVLLILSLVAWGLSRRSALEVSLLETYQGKLRSYAAARAGVNRVLELMERFPSKKDTLYSSGIDIHPGQIPKDVFSHIDVGRRTYAMVEWSARGFGDHVEHLVYGLQDEQGKININAINENNYQILSALFELKGLSRTQADALVLAIVGFRTTGYQYKHLFELLEVSGVTEKIFEQIKDDVTVYGDAQNGLWVNMDTANDAVIQALANAAGRVNPLVEAKDIVRQSYAVRNGADGRLFTADDGSGSFFGNVQNWPPTLREGNSSYLRARVIGVDEDTKMRTVIEAIIHRTSGFSGNQIIGWHRDY